MRNLVVKRNHSISRLAWVARVDADGDVRAVAGPWVEAGRDYVFEGCWNGSFSIPNIEESYSFMGSGLVIRDDKVIVVSPCNNTEAIYFLKDGNSILFSNSVPLILKIGNADLDKEYLDYEADFLSVTYGLDNYIRTTPLADGRTLNIRYCCNLAVDDQLTVSEEKKPEAQGFTDFADYSSFLRSELDGIVKNANDPRRIRQFPPIVFCSNGYDSSLCAAIGKEIGCDEAVVFESKKGTRTDSGKAVVEALGYSYIHEKHELDYLNYPAAHLFLSSGELGTSVFIAASADELEGKTKLNGVRGDAFWDRSGEPRDPSVGRSLYSDTARKEFRLAVGHLNVVVPFLGYTRIRDIHRISNSDEMRPWRLDNDYDRPIPRRIVEEAGVPREVFGIRKDDGAGSSIRFGTLQMLEPVMPAENYASFKRFIEERNLRRQMTPQWIIRTGIYWVFMGLTFLKLKGVGMPAKVLRIEEWPIKYHCSPLAPSYLFHWGVQEVQERQYAGVTL